MLVSFIIVYVSLFQKRKNKHLLEIMKLRQNFQQQILKSQLETQEETLDVISKELHDNIGQLLNSTKLLLGIAQRDPDNRVDTMKVAEETLGKAIGELRALSKSLNKDWMQQFDLVENLQNEVNRINQSGVFHVDFTYPKSISLNHDKQIILFRVIQEAMQNSIKHAKASNEQIRIEELNSLLAITIEDNGIGFESNDTSKNGIGIINMKNRIRLLDGDIQWLISPTGTTVKIDLPLHA